MYALQIHETILHPERLTFNICDVLSLWLLFTQGDSNYTGRHSAFADVLSSNAIFIQQRAAISRSKKQKNHKPVRKMFIGEVVHAN